MSNCLSDQTVMEFLERRVRLPELHDLQNHLGQCSACMELVTVMAGDYFAEHELPIPFTPTAELASRPELLAPASVVPALAVPESVDEFRILSPLGRGAMGQVFIGHDTLLERTVAIKFLTAVEPGPAARERLLVEARAIARLMHPNVVAIHTVGEYAGHPYLVSELVRGRSLDKLDKPLPWEEVHRMSLDLARGLAAAHRRGVVHRDLKPANAILSEDGVVKLLDFGLAKLREASGPEERDGPRTSYSTAITHNLPSELAVGSQSSSAARLPPSTCTERGAMIGTPLYMAPEVWLGQPASAASDVYSLGVLLYELCTGAPPHIGSTLNELRSHVLGAAPMPISAGTAHVDRAFAEAIMRCLNRDPTARFPSADEMLLAFSQITPRTAVTIPRGNPYRGLAAFHAEHRALYFGREGDVETAVERLRNEPLLVLAGDSGVGKSSLCYAGVIPRLIDSSFADGRQFSLATVLPGKEPLRALAFALAPYLNSSDSDTLSLAQTAPADIPRILQERMGVRGGLVLFIDQMEELITQSEPAVADQAAWLLAQLAGRWPGIRVLASVRGDFLTRAAALPGLGCMMVAHLQFVLPLSPDALRIVVAEPARRKGFVFTPPELVDEIVQSLHSDGGLPLLQFALAQLWEQRDEERRTITEQALQRIGGVTGALTCHADQVLSTLLPAQQAAARRLLCKLVTAQDTRMRRRESELRTSDPAELPALDALLRGRLLVARGGGEASEYEVAHEALIRDWPQLRNWLTAEGDRRLVRQRLEQASCEWERLGRTRDSLWNDAQLRELNSVGVDRALLGERENHFLQAAAAAQVRRRRLRVAMLMLLPMVIVSLGFLGLLSQRSQREASQAQKFARHTQESAQRESGLRAYALALQGGREREALLGAIKAVELSLRDGSGQIQTVALTALRAAVQVGRQSLPLSGHRTAARWAAFSPDGERVVTVDDSEEARMWETATGRLLAVLEHRAKFSYRVLYSRDGNYVVVPLLSGATQLWDARKGKLLAQLDGGTGPVSHAAVSPDGRFLATVSGMSSNAKPFLHIWELSTQRLLRSIRAHETRIEWVEYSPDGRLLLTASWDHTARLFDSQTGRPIAILRGHKDQIDMATFSPDGKRVLSVSGDGTARLWAAPSGVLQAVLRGHTGLILWGTFSPDGERVLTAGLDGTARVWDIKTGTIRHTLALHNAPVRTAVATADSKRIITAGDDQTIRIWSMQTGQELTVLRGHSQQVMFAFVSSNDHHIVSGDMSGAIRLWSGASGKHLNTLRGSFEFSNVIFSADGSYMATNGDETMAQQIWDGNTGFPIARLSGHAAPSSTVALSQDGRYALTVGLEPPDTTLRLWHTLNGDNIATLQGAPASSRTIGTSVDGRWIVAVDANRVARVFDWKTGSVVYAHPLRFRGPSSIGLSPDSKHLAVGYEDGSFEVLDTVTGHTQLRGVFPECKSATVAFSPDGKWLVLVGQDSVIHRWDVPRFSVAPTLGLSDWARSLTFSPDSRWLAARLKNTVSIMNVASGRMHRELEHPKERPDAQYQIMYVNFSNDSHRIVTASYDRTARIWDVETGKVSGTLRGHSAFVNSAAFSPDGTRVATSSGDGTARIWDATTGELAPLPDPGTLLVAVKPLVEAEINETAASASRETADPLLALACRLLRYQSEYAQVESTCRVYQP